VKEGLGYIFCGNEKKDKDLKAFRKISKKKKINLILFNLSKKIDEKEIEEKAKNCKIIFNGSAEKFSIEMVKTLEILGEKVIDSSKGYYYPEDKWLFFLMCKKNKIPTVETILLSENLNLIEKELKKFEKWPVVLKRIEGTCGEYVEKAKTPKEAINIIKRFWKNGKEKLPIIAQEFIKSPSYRITSVDGRIVQTSIKKSTHWKNTGKFSERFRKIKIDAEMKKITKKIFKVTKIRICGIDLFKKDGKWLVLEANSSPGFGFFENARERLVNETISLLLKEKK
jgi:glutathione synthase/RimK-type ligase-like ATP-grasp enzyme